MNTRRNFLKMAAIAPAIAHAATRKPNIILIVADDMGYADTGFTGAKDIKTPNLDKLAQSGAICAQGYVSHPFCSPTRAGLMTGRYQARFGHENNPFYDPTDAKEALPLSEILLPQVLKQAGYVTGIIGKWHLGATPQHHPMRRGFDHQYGFIGGGHDYFQAEVGGEPREYLVPMLRDGKPEPLTEYLTDALSKEAVAFVKTNAAKPFFLYLAFNAPHTPQMVTGKYMDRYKHISEPKRQKYAAMISALDDGVGELMATLKANKLDEDTLIFFFSDNGGPIAVNGSTNGPYRGAKGQVLEGGIHVPFAVRWKGKIPAGSTYHQPVISLDIFASAVAAAGATLPKDRKSDSVDLLPYLTGKNKQAPHDRLFWRTNGGVLYGMREGDWKLVRKGKEKPALYNLKTDPGESNDLAETEPAMTARMTHALDTWDRELIPPAFNRVLQNNQNKKKKG